jgi:hypothetical protein
MAKVYGNPGQSYGNGGGVDYTANKYILREAYRKSWFVYRSTGGSFVRPYPVFDAAGNPCPSRDDNATQADHTMLPEAFAVLGTVSFAGVNSDLELIDYCSDIERYLPAGVEYMRTPFTTLIATLKKMLPPANGNHGVGADGYQTPRQLLQLQKNIGYPTSTILFRGALCRHKGSPMTTKVAVEGIAFNTVFCITQKSSTNSFYAQLNQARDFAQPVSAVNNMFDTMFNLKGVGIQFNKGVGASQGTADTYQVSALYDPNYESIACRKFGCTPEGYNNALREFFGPAQRIEDILNIMTVQEMVDVIKANYPISWIWYSFKDSPYADLITQEERMQAQADPEMTQRFGLIGNTAPAPVYNPQTPPPSAYPASAPQTPPPAPMQQQASAEPSWNSAGYNPQPQESSFRGTPSSSVAAGYPQPSVGHTPPMPSGVRSSESSAMTDFLSKYGVKENPGIPDNDGIQY